MKKSFSTTGVLARLAFWLFLAAVVAITAVVMFSDSGKVLQLLGQINPGWLPLIIGSVLFNYLLRFIKWQFFLGQVGVKVPLKSNLWVFFSAFTMVLSPGKIGELVKSFLLRGRHAVPVAKTAPVVMAERVTDLLGLVILCLIGFSQFAFGGRTIFFAAALMVMSIIMITRPRLWQAIDRFFARFSALSRFRRPIMVIQSSTSDLFTLKSLFFTVPLSAISWAGEGLALYLIFRALNVDLPMLLLISVFAHAFSSIVGALSFLPGGLLVTEGALGMFFIYVNVADAQAVSATFLIRAVTLWFAVILGTAVFLLGHTRDDLAALAMIGDNSSQEASDHEK